MVTVTVLVPPVVKELELLVLPFDQIKEFPDPRVVAVSVVEEPSQKMRFPEICRFGSNPAVKVTLAGGEIQLPLEAVKV